MGLWFPCLRFPPIVASLCGGHAEMCSLYLTRAAMLPNRWSLFSIFQFMSSSLALICNIRIQQIKLQSILYKKDCTMFPQISWTTFWPSFQDCLEKLSQINLIFKLNSRFWSRWPFLDALPSFMLNLNVWLSIIFMNRLPFSLSAFICVLQGGNYVLPLRLWGAPITMSCPIAQPLPPSVTCLPSGMVVKIGGIATNELKVKGWCFLFFLIIQNLVQCYF